MYSQEILANYLSSAQLDQLRAEGNVIRDKDIERLSPLMREYITLNGRYYFARPKAVQRGEIRALRNPRDEFGISTCPRVGTKTQGFRSIATRTPKLGVHRRMVRQTLADKQQRLAQPLSMRWWDPVNLS